jgi:hypothetical protein
LKAAYKNGHVSAIAEAAKQVDMLADLSQLLTDFRIFRYMYFCFEYALFFGPVHVRTLREPNATIPNRSGGFGSTFDDMPWTGRWFGLWFLLSPL